MLFGCSRGRVCLCVEVQDEDVRLRQRVLRLRDRLAEGHRGEDQQVMESAIALAVTSQIVQVAIRAPPVIPFWLYQSSSECFR